MQIEIVKAIARVAPDEDWDTFKYLLSKASPNQEELQLKLWDNYHYFNHLLDNSFEEDTGIL